MADLDDAESCRRDRVGEVSSRWRHGPDNTDTALPLGVAETLDLAGSLVETRQPTTTGILTNYSSVRLVT